MESYLTEDTNVIVELNHTAMAQLVEELNANFTRYVFPVTVFVGLETIIGFIGNIFVLVIVHLYYKASTFKYFVLCLAVIDIICCTITMPGEMYSQLRWYLYTSEGLCKFKSFFNLSTVVAEAFCLFGIALDRYRKVCRPLKWQIKRRFAKYWCIALFFVAFALSFPLLFLWGIRPGKKEHNGVTISYTVCEKDAAFEHTNYPQIHLAVVATLVCSLLLVMLMMYIIIAKRLCSKSIMEVEMMSLAANDIAPKPSDYSEHCFDVTYTGITDKNTTTLPNNIESRRTVKNVTATSVENQDTVPINRLDKGEGPITTPLSRRNVIMARVRRKTLIMFILTITFVITIFTYFALITHIASFGEVLDGLSDKTKMVYFFFTRFYFINHAINPFVYGVLDPKFKAGVKKFCKSIVKKC